ncbi:LAFA_0G20758g1_1 [Lachancea sp. 'fantastica']|nr:LAFA_0G20758g1_1 [Lachancea sp. 'fantastica']
MLSPQLSELLTWGSDNGITWPNGLQFLERPEKGISAVATAKISHATLQVPKQALFSGELAENYFNSDQNTNSLLKLLLAKLKFDPNSTSVNAEDLKSKFGPYIRALPKEIASPLVWNPKELDLLGNTNLRTSIAKKLESMFAEWKVAVGQVAEIKQDVALEIAQVEDILGQGEDQIYAKITSKVFANSLQLSWWSFPAFLWSSIVFLSRAFPEKVVNGLADPSRIILLPVIDLLNHDYRSKVEWRQSNDSFCLEILEDIEEGCEIFNNYGGKGNEELLWGYGFVLEENICDTVALKIKLPPATLHQISKEKSIRLPTLADYTRSAFDLPSEIPKESEKLPLEEKFEDGILYMLSATNNTCLLWLLDVFTFLEKSKTESLVNLRPRLQGLQNLRAALEAKHSSYNAETVYSGAVEYPVSDYRAHAAQNYRSSQIKIIKSSISQLKTLEKNWTSTYKHELLSVNKLMRLDPDFIETQLPILLQLEPGSDIALDSYETLLYLWIIQNQDTKTIPKGLQWVIAQYNQFIDAQGADSGPISDHVRILHQTIFVKDTQKEYLEKLQKAQEFVMANSYIRYSKDEPILVRSIDV